MKSLFLLLSLTLTSWALESELTDEEALSLGMTPIEKTSRPFTKGIKGLKQLNSSSQFFFKKNILILLK